MLTAPRFKYRLSVHIKNLISNPNGSCFIDHGHGLMTLYAFNQSLYKHTGDWVESGDVIATVGQSGGRNQAGLYFGMRQNGTPIDPLEWCHR